MTNFRVEIINRREIWEKYLTVWHSKTTFVQSWSWGDFQSSLGEKTFRFAYFDKKTCVGLAQALFIRARRGHFLFVPHAPLLDWDKAEARNFVMDHLTRVARQHGAAFLRISPYLEDSPQNRSIFRQHGFVPAPIHMHPEHMWFMRVDRPANALLKGMRKGTRYGIRRAEREGVRVTLHTDIKAVEEKFYPLFMETVDRHHFVPFSLKYLKEELRIFAENNEACLFIAHYKSKVLAGALVVYHGNSGFYHQGASTMRMSQLFAPYAVQWAAIQEAKRRGCVWYNFWGIGGEGNPRHPWHGITFFKKGFGGMGLRLLHAQDRPLSIRYPFIYAFEQARRVKRGL